MKRIMPWLLCLAMLFSLAGCATDTDQTLPLFTEPSEGPLERYAQAVQTVEAMEDLTLNVTVEREMTLNADVYTQTYAHTLRLWGLGTGDFAADVSTKDCTGGRYTSMDELFLDGTVYMDLNGSRYRASVSAEEYLARFVPAVLLHSENYRTVSAEGSWLTFHDAVAPEAFLDRPGLELVEATGTARIDETVGIARSTYDVTYRLGDARFREVYTLTLSRGAGQNIPTPGDDYTRLGSWQAPILLRTSLGLSGQSRTVSSLFTSTVTLGSTGVSCSERYLALGCSGEAGYQALLDRSITLAEPEGTAHYALKERYAGGQLTTEYADGTTQVSSLSAESMYAALQTLIPALSADGTGLATARLTTGDSGIRIFFTLDDDHALQAVTQAVGTVYDDPEMFAGLVQDLRVESLNIALTLDPVTGLPTAASLSLNAEYMVDGSTFLLTRQAEQTYSYDPDAILQAMAQQ